jgi:ribonucleoside-diphosphate reductase alpha chain
VEEERKVAALVAAGYPADYEGEAYRTVSGQNSNNSVRVTDDFLAAVASDTTWALRDRTHGHTVKTLKARKLWDDIARAAWKCADPGLQFHTTINDWHTCPADGPIRASNPCSEYMFLDNTACNLASLNLRAFLDEATGRFDTQAYLHAVRLWTVVLEISVLMAQYPSPEIARLSYRFRTLGLGYANLGSLLMVSGIPYDSPRARAVAGALTAMLTAQAYETSAEMAAVLGPFEGYGPNREAMLRVVRNHRYAAYNAADAYEGLHTPPLGIDPAVCPAYLLEAACNAWDRALRLGEAHGFRNAQVSVLAPTGTIGLLMDCDTTGIEPDFALVKFKKLSGGGYFKIVNQSVPLALKTLGYSPHEAEAIVRHAIGHGKLEGAPFINPESLKAKGFTDADLAKVNYILPSAFDIAHAFAPYVLGEAALRRLGFAPEQYEKPGFHLLRALGFTHQQVLEANDYTCGTQTVEGAPFLHDEHLPVFDCANRCGRTGTRYIHAHGHLRMMAAAQSFISGAISKTINLPNEATWEEIRECYALGHKWGLKAISVYRDGSKLSQPLSTQADTETDENPDSAAPPARNGTEPLGEEQLVAAVRHALASPAQSPLGNRLRQLVARRPLPNRRNGYTQKAKIDGQTVFVRTGEYEDGSLGEIFIDIAKEGATLRSLMNCFAIAVSIGLQHGVPLEEFVDKFAFTRFDPSGPVQGHPNIKNATSIVDFVFRLLAFDYLGRQDLVHVLPAILDDTVSTHEAERDAPPASLLPETVATTAPATPQPHTQSLPTEAQQQQLANLMGDAPACNVCGHITVRSGTCYKCLNCGNSLGCS